MTSSITKLREAVEAWLARLGWWLVNRFDPHEYERTFPSFGPAIFGTATFFEYEDVRMTLAEYGSVRPEALEAQEADDAQNES